MKPAPNIPNAPLRLLIIMPKWVGDVAMATPTLRLIRQALPGAFIGGLVRPGIDEVLAGSDVFDELHVERASGVMGPKFVAAKLRPRRYDTALLLTGSFSTALTARIAGIPRRIGYDRDSRGLLLTDKVRPLTLPNGKWKPISAVHYYYTLARRFLPLNKVSANLPEARVPAGRLIELATTPAEEHAADQLLARADVPPTSPMAILNPGANSEVKRWPTDRFAAVADYLASRHGLTVLVNGGPAERDLVATLAAACTHKPIQLTQLGGSLGSLKAITRRCRLMVTNDTGPRFIAAAFGVPVITLMGPTDHRWSTIETRSEGPEALILADPTLPDELVANDHQERCRMDRIELKDVIAAADKLLALRASTTIEAASEAAVVQSGRPSDRQGCS